jgi:hypothetical protein
VGRLMARLPRRVGAGFHGSGLVLRVGVRQDSADIEPGKGAGEQVGRRPPAGACVKAGPPVQLRVVDARSARRPCVAVFAVLLVESNSAVWPCDWLVHRFGNAGGRPDRERRYPSDMTDTEWAVDRDAIPTPGRLEGRGGPVAVP